MRHMLCCCITRHAWLLWPSRAAPLCPLPSAPQDAFDWPSEISRMYKIRSSPRFLFFVDVRGGGGGEGGRVL